MAIVNTVFKRTNAISKIRHITVGALRISFTLSEKVLIETHANPEIRVLEKDMMSSKYIDLDDIDLLWGLAIYQNEGVLIEGRIAQLLVDGTEAEKYRG